MGMLKFETTLKLTLCSLILLAPFTGSAASLMCTGDTCNVTAVTPAKALTKVSEGVRIKKIAFIKVKVYRAELFTSGGTWKKGEDNLLEKIDGNLPIVLRLNLLRDIGGAKIEDSFRDALKANDVDLNSTGIKELMAAVKSTKEIKENETASFVGFKKATGEEVVILVGPDGKETETQGSPGFIKNLFSIWFGKPADDQLAQTKKDLLGL
ncbi:MAG: chalcone isomerase family protein [Bdellovibrionota bacterium]